MRYLGKKGDWEVEPDVSLRVPLGGLEEMEHICHLTNLTTNSQFLKLFIEPILTNVLIWMIVVSFSWNFQCPNYFNMDKKFIHQREYSYFDSKRPWIDHYNWKKYLIDNSEVYSKPSLTFTMELFANIFNGKTLFPGVPCTLALNKSNTKIATGKISFLRNSLNLIFKK